jgi:hypothetical protein
MSETTKVQGCVASAAGPLATRQPAAEAAVVVRKEARMNVMVGKEAPDFEATAYHEDGFKNVKLSSFRSRWVFLCFYPGDFTFV